MFLDKKIGFKGWLRWGIEYVEWWMLFVLLFGIICWMGVVCWIVKWRCCVFLLVCLGYGFLIFWRFVVIVVMWWWNCCRCVLVLFWCGWWWFGWVGCWNFFLLDIGLCVWGYVDGRFVGFLDWNWYLVLWRIFWLRIGVLVCWGYWCSWLVGCLWNMCGLWFFLVGLDGLMGMGGGKFVGGNVGFCWFFGFVVF